MAAALKDQFNQTTVCRIADMIAHVHAEFPRADFIADCLAGFEPLPLMDRARHIRDAMAKHLPAEFPAAARILEDSLGATLTDARSFGMGSFAYLPHVYFCSSHGLAPESFDSAMSLQKELTRRFTAEFSIRAFIELYPAKTLAVLRQWASDPDEHVRRLVSEGSRPRLPWAKLLHRFVADPAEAIELLELLKDDPSLYVRRSVANHLNDIGKDHPDTLTDTAASWITDASPERRWIIRHALRVAVKKGNPKALAILGFPTSKPRLELSEPSVAPRRASLGDSVTLQFTLANPLKKTQKAMVDFQVHFVKANGSTSPKVFKLKAISLEPGQTLNLSKKLSLAPMTTRTLHAGEHRIDALINGHPFPLGSFRLS